MQKLILAAALGLALAACDNAAEESDDVTVAATPAATASVTAESMAGNYEITLKDGTKASSMLMADGTYMDMDASGAETASGTWQETADGKVCFDPEGEEGPTCYTIGETQPDGSFTATPDNGDPITVRKTD